MRLIPVLVVALSLSGCMDPVWDVDPPEIQFAKGKAAQRLLEEHPRQPVVVGETKYRPFPIVLLSSNDDPQRVLDLVSRPLTLECETVGPDLCCDRENDSLLFQTSDRYVDTGEKCPIPDAGGDLVLPERPLDGIAYVVRLDKDLTAEFERETGVDYAQMTMPGPTGDLVLVKLYYVNPKPPRCGQFTPCGHTISGNVHQYCRRWSPNNWTYVWDEIEGDICRIPRYCNCTS